MAPVYDDHAFLARLATAAETDLLRAQNPAFMALHNNVLFLKGQLTAQR